MNNNKEINTTLRNLNLGHSYNTNKFRIGNTFDKQNNHINYGNLGIEHPATALKNIHNMQPEIDSDATNIEDIDAGIDSVKLANKVTKQLKKSPKNSYVFDPDQSDNLGEGIDYTNMQKIAQGKRPHSKDIIKALKKHINKIEKSLYQVQSMSSKLEKRTKQNKLTNDDLGYGLNNLSNVVNKYQSLTENPNRIIKNPVNKFMKKNNIKDLTDIDDKIHDHEDFSHDAVNVNGFESNKLLTKRQARIKSEIENRTKYTFAQVKPHLTGKNDFKPLSNSLVNKISTTINNYANHHIKFFGNKMRSINKLDVTKFTIQNPFNKIGMKSPSQNKMKETNHNKISPNGVSINVQKHHKKQITNNNDKIKKFMNHRQGFQR